MTGFDSSAKMVELARQRLGADAALLAVDLGSARELFPDELAKFPSGAFLSFLFFVLEAAQG